MRFPFILVLFVALLPSSMSIAALTVFELAAKSAEIAKTLYEILLSINNHADLVKTDENKKEKLVFSKLDMINLQIIDIDEQLHGIGNDVNMIIQMLNNLPEVMRLELKLHDIHTKQFFLDTYYSEMEKYVRDFDEYENITLINFANEVVSGKLNSVPFLMKLLYQQVTTPSFLQLFYEQFAAKQTSYFCNGQQSPSEVFHNFLNEIVMLNTKSYIMTQTAYMIKKIYRIGNFLKEIKDSNKEFREQTNGLIQSIKPFMAKASAELWRCNPEKHKEGETFVQITNFLHGYIINKVNLDPHSRCRDECSVYTYTKKIKCHDNKWCKNQPLCPKTVKCQYIDSSMEICSKDMHIDNRRYQYIKYGNGRIYGKKESCPNNRRMSLETYIYWIIWRCSYCFCLCDEGPQFFSDRYINLRPSLTNLTENRVVIGVRFVKHNQIIHMQIQEGKLLPFGQIDLDSIRWIPPEDFTTIDKNIHDGKDYHTITWEQRGFDLADIKTKDGSVVTGVRFRKVGTRLHLEVHTTPFNFTTGKLNSKKSIFEDDPHLIFKHKFKRELKLNKPDIPTLSESQSTDFTTNKYVDFTHSDIVKDAAQTTVPFFDAQPVASAKPVPLMGIGIFHKGRDGYGGFIAPRLFSYNFSKHLEPVFPLDKKQGLKHN